MTSIRLLPILIFATFALLVFKAVDLAVQGPGVLAGISAVMAQDQAQQVAELSSEEEAAARRASDSLFNDAGEMAAPDPDAPRDAVPTSETKAGDKVPLATEDGTALTEKEVLLRLSERRAELERYAQDLETRASLVQAAEKRLAERIAGLEALETRINQLVDQKKAMDDEQFASVVSMYEAMKPKDAASIFDELDMPVLVRVAQKMNPRKLGPVMAKMATLRAQELTVRLAEFDPEPALDSPVEDLSDLPQIVGQ